MSFVYILKSIMNEAYYVGSCMDIVERLKRHNEGSVRSTKRYIPWNLVYFEEYKNLKEARKREKQIKAWKKRRAIENLIRHFKI